MVLGLAALFALSGPMTAETVIDPITDQVRAVATLRQGDQRLEIGCAPDRVRRIWVQLISNRWFRSGNVFNHHITFTHRFDDARARRMMWRVDERSALLVGRNRVDPFIHQLLSSDRLIIRAPGPEARTYDIVFEIQGAREAIDNVLEACGDRLRTRL